MTATASELKHQLFGARSPLSQARRRVMQVPPSPAGAHPNVQATDCQRTSATLPVARPVAAAPTAAEQRALAEQALVALSAVSSAPLSCSYNLQSGSRAAIASGAAPGPSKAPDVRSIISLSKGWSLENFRANNTDRMDVHQLTSHHQPNLRANGLPSSHQQQQQRQGVSSRLRQQPAAAVSDAARSRPGVGLASASDVQAIAQRMPGLGQWKQKVQAIYGAAGEFVSRIGEGISSHRRVSEEVAASEWKRLCAVGAY
jgi:hypothetical protein